MIKVFSTNAVISKGYNGAAAIRFSDTGDSARFRIGKKVYDKKKNKSTDVITIDNVETEAKETTESK